MIVSLEIFLFIDVNFSNLLRAVIAKGIKSSSFDYAITFSATIELIHPGFDIFKELYRVVDKGFIFIINENAHSYPRFYRYQINSRGFKIINCKKFSEDLTLLDCMKIWIRKFYIKQHQFLLGNISLNIQLFIKSDCK